MGMPPILCKIGQPLDFFHTPDSVPMDSLGSKCMARIVCHRKTWSDRQQNKPWPPRNALPSNRTSEHTLDRRDMRNHTLILLLCRLHFHLIRLTVYFLLHRLVCDLPVYPNNSNIKIFFHFLQFSAWYTTENSFRCFTVILNGVGAVHYQTN